MLQGIVRIKQPVGALLQCCSKWQQQNVSRSLTTTSCRASMYPPNFVEPLTEKGALNEPLPEGDPRRFNPIRAPGLKNCPNVFNDEMIAKFVNMIMRSGRQQLAQNMVLKGLENIKRVQVKKYHEASTDEDREGLECNPVEIFRTAISNMTPVVCLKPVQRGGITYQVPSPLNQFKARQVAMRYLRDAVRDKRRHVRIPESMCKEVLDAYNNEGRCVKRKQELHRQAEANRAYVHFRWAKKKGMKGRRR